MYIICQTMSGQCHDNHGEQQEGQVGDQWWLALIMSAAWKYFFKLSTNCNCWDIFPFIDSIPPLEQDICKMKMEYVTGTIFKSSIEVVTFTKAESARVRVSTCYDLVDFRDKSRVSRLFESFP